MISDEHSFGIQGTLCSLYGHLSLLLESWLDNLSFEKLQKKLYVGFLSKIVCKLCRCGKHHHSTYLSHDEIPLSTPFDLIHCDGGGQGILFFLPSWAISTTSTSHTITPKSLLFVTSLIIEVFIQYATILKILCKYNALKLVQDSLCLFYVDCDIIHHKPPTHIHPKSMI